MLTGNRVNVLSVQFFSFEGKNYLGASGDGYHFEVFDVSKLSNRTPLSKCFLFL